MPMRIRGALVTPRRTPEGGRRAGNPRRYRTGFPPPLAGEGWGGGTLPSMCCGGLPPPRPPPRGGEGDSEGGCRRLPAAPAAMVAAIVARLGLAVEAAEIVGGEPAAVAAAVVARLGLAIEPLLVAGGRGAGGAAGRLVLAARQRRA